MTKYQVVYDAFLARIREDEWDNWFIEDARKDWRAILEAALPWFKFPRVSLEHDESGFSGDRGPEEIQIIAIYLQCEWLNRCIMTWENVKPLYDERDFSQANLIDKLNAMVRQERANALALESVYYRSRKGKPFDYSLLAKN